MSEELRQLFNWSEQTWLYLDQAGILGGDIMLGLSIVGGAWAWMRRERIRRWFTRNRFPSVGGDAEPEQKWDALVFTVSRPEVPQWVFETLKPAHVAFVASEHSRAAADALAAAAKTQGIDPLPIRLVADPDDPAQSRREVANLLEQLRELGAEAPAVDLTGGKVPMSLGAFMAAEEQQAASLYVTCDYAAGKPRMDTARILRISQPPDA